jgi:hypothetical protein
LRPGIILLSPEKAVDNQKGLHDLNRSCNPFLNDFCIIRDPTVSPKQVHAQGEDLRPSWHCMLPVAAVCGKTGILTPLENVRNIYTKIGILDI